MTDIADNASTTATISVGGSFSGALEVARDHDWIAVTLAAGQAVAIALDGLTLSDPYLRIYDKNGALLFENNDISEGVNLDCRIAFNPNYSGTYYIDVGAYRDAGTGTYSVSVEPYTTPAAGTIDQIAAQLTSGFWLGDTHRFNVSQGGSITVNISTLSPAEQALARAALKEWSDIIGITFQETSGTAQITFDNSEDSTGSIAATDADWSNGVTNSAHIQISSSWVNTYGTALDSYSFQTYVHEIGHALGLGHAGDYNGTARYPYDALFANDAWPLSVMSYFSMTDNSSYNYPATYVLSPMAADIVAMQSLYGLSTTTRTGDTTYGFNSNAGGIYDASLYPNASYAIFDSGGTDNLDFSGGTYTQRINLNPDTFTSFRHNLDIYIARGVTIENVISGSGDDTIVQNSANNILNGGPGSDTVSYTTATAGIAVDLRLAGAQNTLGAGVDTLINIEQLIGTAFNDALTGGSATTRLEGGAGNDLLQSGGRITGSIGLYGGDGDDTFILGDASDWADGGDGFDTVDYSGATAGVLASTSGRVGASVDTLLNVERIIGSNFADDLYAWDAGAAVVGGAGDDILRSMWGSATLTGGTGSDTFRGSPDGLNNDVITDFSRGDRILISNVSNFSISLVGEHLIYAGGSLTLSGVRMPSLRVSLSYEGGMQILFDGPPIVLAGGSSVTLATSAKSIELTSEAPSMVAHDFSGRAGIPGADWMPPLDVAHYDASLAVPDLLG